MERFCLYRIAYDVVRYEGILLQPAVGARIQIDEHLVLPFWKNGSRSDPIPVISYVIAWINGGSSPCTPTFIFSEQLPCISVFLHEYSYTYRFMPPYELYASTIDVSSLCYNGLYLPGL